METKFTKGKWIVKEFGSEDWDKSISIEPIEFISFENNEEANANALLISKAPEMFEMLQSVLELQKENYGSGMNTHLALITKVEEIKHLLKEATEL